VASIGMQIILAIQDILTDPPMSTVAAEDVRTDPISPADLNSGTAINIELGDEPPPNLLVIGFKDRDVEVTLTFMATGPTAVSDVDAVMVEAHAKLFADATLGGLCFDINELGTIRQNAVNGKRLAVIEKTYSVNYRTSETTMDS